MTISSITNININKMACARYVPSTFFYFGQCIRLLVGHRLRIRQNSSSKTLVSNVYFGVAHLSAAGLRTRSNRRNPRTDDGVFDVHDNCLCYNNSVTHAFFNLDKARPADIVSAKPSCIDTANSF
uniref:Uncharacterized protein n=1 Tax=Sipha flava TaxID=143950 RepID=A0A2S2QID2_9HEMI